MSNVAPRFVPDGRPNGLLRLVARIAKNLALDGARRDRALPLEPHDEPEIEPSVPDPLLRETMLGRWEGMTEPEIVASGDGEAWDRWRSSPDLHRPPESEPLDQVCERMLDALGQIRRSTPSGSAGGAVPRG